MDDHIDQDTDSSLPITPRTPPLDKPPHGRLWDRPTRDQPLRDPSTRDHSTRDHSSRANASRDRSSRERSLRERLGRDDQYYVGDDSVEDLSTIDANSRQDDVQEVYQELQDINSKLKREMSVLHQRDLVLRQKEKSLQELQMSLETAIDNEVKRRMSSYQKEHQREVRKLEDCVREKGRENKRIKENFEALKNANDILRKELDTLTGSHEKLEKQYQSLQGRFINLQRRREPEEKKESDKLPADLTQKLYQNLMPKQKPAQKKPKAGPREDMLSSLLDWVCESELRQKPADQPSRLDNTNVQEQIEDRCFKMLPSVIELVRDQTSATSQVTLPCLQFIYWALLRLEASKSQHLRSSLSTTLRRLGDGLYRGQHGESDRADMFYKSTHLHTRLVSGLLILKSISQVDQLAQVYEGLRNDLKSDTGKEYFLYYQATNIMLSHLKPSNKALTNSALDVYLQMCMDTPYLRNFLDSCSNDSWFQSLSLVWKMPGVEAKQHEKMSIILQKLSKIRLNKRYFDVFGLTSSCQELQRSASSLSPFLSLNLKSIVFNLSAIKPATKPQ